MLEEQLCSALCCLAEAQMGLAGEVQEVAEECEALLLRAAQAAQSSPEPMQVALTFIPTNTAQNFLNISIWACMCSHSYVGSGLPAMQMPWEETPPMPIFAGACQSQSGAGETRGGSALLEAIGCYMVPQPCLGS